MNKNRLVIYAFITALISMALASCGGSEASPTEVMMETEAAPVLNEEGETAADTDIEFPADEVITDLKQIEGTWIAAAYPGNFVLTVFPDGTLSVATSLEDLQAGNTDSWQLTIEEGEITATGYALCLGDVGTYIATMKDDGILRFTSIIDPCDARLRKMDRSLPGRLNEYILLYHPVN